MIYLTQLVYIVKGKEDSFHQYEKIAITAIQKYNGQLTLRIRPDKKYVIENAIEVPYEVHMVEFKTQEDFDQFKNDKERRKFMHLKEDSIRSTILIQGVKLN